MSNQINLVQGDSGPDLTIILYDAASNAPIDVSGGSDVVRLYLRREGQTGTPTVTTVVGTKSNGGSDGVVTFVWAAGTFDVVGHYECEIETTYGTGKKETVPDKIRFYVREQIA